MIHRLLRGLRSVRVKVIPTGPSLLTALFLLVSMTAFAAPADKNTNPCNLNDDEIQGLNHDASTEAKALDVYIGTISSMLHQERFDQLDCVSDRARANKERFPGGHWKIHLVYLGLNDPVPDKHATDEDWQDLLRLLQRWVDTHPKSTTARVGLAWAWIGYAAAARGNGYAETVSQNGWKLYEQRTAKAQEVLDEAATLPVTCPESYLVKMNIAQHQSWSKDRIVSLFGEAWAFEPGYYYYGRAVAMLLEPKWFGDPGDTAKFLQESADRIGGKQGDAYYFLVASSKDVICGCEDQPKLSLERIERGYSALEELYGVSMYNLNQLAFLTLHVPQSDVTLADQTLQRIGTQWTKYSWGDEETFAQTKDWIRQMLPIMKQNLARKAEAEANAKTPEGARYEAGAEKAYRDLLRDCVRSDGGEVREWDGAFETLIEVAANGSVQDANINSMGPVVRCMLTKMRTSHETKTPLFSAPPKDFYWVRIELDWAEFAPQAAER